MKTRTQKWPDEVVATLRLAGWYEGRSAVKDEPGLASWMSRHKLSVVASRALDEFGGLVVKVSGPGIDMAKTGFTVDPRPVFSELDRLQEYASSFSPEIELFPLGETLDGHAILAIDQRGRVFLVMDSVMLIGETVEEAIANLILGKRK